MPFNLQAAIDAAIAKAVADAMAEDATADAAQIAAIQAAALKSIQDALAADAQQDAVVLATKDTEIAQLKARIAVLEAGPGPVVPPPVEPPPPPPPGGGTPQRPGFLAGYAYKPSWPVAGVDYAVGPKVGTVFKSLSQLPAGVTRVGNTLRVSANNVTFDGYDLSGVCIEISASNTKIINCLLDGKNPGGSMNAAITGINTPNTANLYVGYCSIDGMSGAGGRAEFLIVMDGPGLVVEYCWLRRVNSDLIGRHGRSGGTIVIQNNLMEQAGQVAGTHGDYLQVYGPTIDDTKILYNTAIQSGGSTQGFIADNTKQGEIAYNVMIGNPSYWCSMSGPGTKSTTFTGPSKNHDNFFHVTNGGYGYNYPSNQPGDGIALTTFTNNVNMVTGAKYQD